MFKNGYYYIDGEALDVDALFRLRDTLVSYAYEDIKKSGYIPAGPLPEVHTADTNEGTISYSFRWKVIPSGR